MKTIIMSVFLLLGLSALAAGTPLPNNEHRNKTSVASSLGIIGGHDADIKNYPYQVAILFLLQAKCGGSILANNFILTAAHSFNEDTNPAKFTIRAGSTNCSSGGKLYRVKKITIHPGYNKDTFDNDVAVLELSNPLPLGTPGVQKIELPPSNTTFTDGQTATLTGWGMTGPNKPMSAVLQKADNMPLITTDTCRTSTKYLPRYRTGILDSHFCAGALNLNACLGDSGGPLVMGGYQIGIVAFGNVCSGEVAVPTVYTKVTKVLDFIKGIIS